MSPACREWLLKRESIWLCYKILRKEIRRKIVVNYAMKKNKLFATALAMMVMAGNCVIPAFALEYNYTTDPYDGFYKSTSADDDAIANSDTIVVGSDGTI